MIGKRIFLSYYVLPSFPYYEVVTRTVKIFFYCISSTQDFYVNWLFGLFRFTPFPGTYFDFFSSSPLFVLYVTFDLDSFFCTASLLIPVQVFPFVPRLSLL